MTKTSRRSILTTGVAAVAAAAAPAPREKTLQEIAAAPRFRLGMVTYELGKNWDIDTLIRNCIAARFEAAELRTTHRHGVEISLSKDQRVEVRKKFADSPVRLLSLGTMCEYHSPDRSVVDSKIEETKRWCELAHDLGCLGVKVRPNGLPKEVSEEKTLAQIGNALERCGESARSSGVELWVEVHGAGSQEPSRMQRILELAHHSSVGICWNSNPTDVMNDSVAGAFEMLKPWLRNVHINELWRAPAPWTQGLGQPTKETIRDFPWYSNPYPYREFFRLLRESGYDRYTLAEVPESQEPARFMLYYRALWEALQ